MLDGLEVLRSTVIHPWESLDRIVDLYGQAELGNPQVPGTPAWHLQHIVETFQLHARTATEGELQFEALSSSAPSALRDTLLHDVERFIGWVNDQSEQRLLRKIQYMHEMDLQEMLGVMSRHIIWHAAAVHYLLRDQHAAAARTT